MNILLWTLASLLAAMFVMAGAGKLLQPKDKLAASPNMAWTEDFSPEMLKTIGILEVLAAFGLILPAALDITPVLVPLAALGLAALMIGAVITHARRHETKNIVINLVLLVITVVVAWGRFGPHSFT
jgi:uncharacterized membrane protein YphA (DoxX/SURF4 family)